MQPTPKPVPPATIIGVFLAALGLLIAALGLASVQENNTVALAGRQAYIDLLYAQNLADGLGPRYLPDHPKSLEAASSLRVVLMTVAAALLDGCDAPVVAIAVLSIASLWVGLVGASLWLRRVEGGGLEVAFMLVTLSNGAILWLVWSGDESALTVPLALLSTLSLYGRSLVRRRVWVSGVSGFFLGLCSWPGYAYAVGTTLFLWTAAVRGKPSFWVERREESQHFLVRLRSYFASPLLNPFRLLFWAAALPALGGAGLILLNWAWTGYWDGGGPLAEPNLLACLSIQSILRLDWTKGVLHVVGLLGSLGAPASKLAWIVVPVTLLGVLWQPRPDDPQAAHSRLVPFFQFFCMLAFLGFQPDQVRGREILAFLPVFLVFTVRGVGGLAILVNPAREVAAWLLLLCLAVVNAWWLPGWYNEARQKSARCFQSAILPAREIQTTLSSTGRIAVGDDPALLWYIGSGFRKNGYLGSGYRFRANVAGKEYGGMKRDTFRLLLEVPDVVVFPLKDRPGARSSFPYLETAGKEFAQVSYTVQRRDHAVMLAIPEYVPLWQVREQTMRRLLEMGNEQDVLWSIVARDLRPGLEWEQRLGWRERLERSLARLVGERWDFEDGVPERSEIIGEGVEAGWSSPPPAEGVSALHVGGPANPERLGTILSKEFTLAGDLIQLRMAGVGSATECFVSLLVHQSTRGRSFQPTRAVRAEHFHHWTGEPLRGDVFYYLLPGQMRLLDGGWEGWRVVRTASAPGGRSWASVEWPVRAWQGMRARWQITDRTTQGWIAVDSIRQMLLPPGRYWDFEDGTYEGWSAEGEAFGDHPVIGPFPGQQPISGYQGDFFVNTYLNGSDIAHGVLRSATFPIDHPYLRFRIGGGDYPLRTALNLYVDGVLALTATGNRDEHLRKVVWDVREAYGREGRLEIVDLESGAWGHVLVDDIALIDEETP